MLRTRILLAAVGWTAVLSASQAADTTLRVGDSAPALQPGKWIQGEPVREFERDKIYIVEFWATWCGPCRVSIPHLNEIHEKFKDKGLVVVGQDVWESNEQEVPKFVQKMGEKMTYRVALDSKNEEKDKGRMAATWMAAAGQNGIPTAFVVDKKGQVAWIGHPMELTDKLIEDVLAGTFDVKEAAMARELREKNQAELQKRFREYRTALSGKDWVAAEKALDEAEKLVPDQDRTMLKMPRFNLLLSKKDYPAAYKHAQEVSEANKENAMLQNELAWKILTDRALEERNLALAETIARRANTAAKGKDAAILDTLARALFMQDKKGQAIDVQKQALAQADDQRKAELQKTLESYQDGKLPKVEE